MHDDDRTSENEKRKPQASPTVSATFDDGTLVELVYDPGARTTAFAVWRGDAWSIEESITRPDGETLVPFSPENNLIKNDVVLLPSVPAEYGSAETLLADIEGYIHRYVDLSPTFEKVASYYVLLSWLYDAFNELPYLRLRGDYGTGKTRALLAVGSLCYKAFFASGASTVSPLFHTLDAFRGTLIFDEADFRFSDEKAQIVKILNNGNVKGLPVLRTVVNHKKEFNPRAFQVFGPKIVATRGFYEDRALESRFLTEEMGQSRLRDDIPINLPRAQKEEALMLRNKLLLYRFRTRHMARLDDSLVDRSIEPRLNQILVPLLSVIDDEALRAELRAVAAQHHAELIAERGFTTEAQALEVIRDLWADSGKTAITVGDITTRFSERYGAEYERPVTNRWIGTILRKKLRLATLKSHGVYVVPLSEAPKLRALYARYGIDADGAGDVPHVSLAGRVDLGDLGDVGRAPGQSGRPGIEAW
jgi:hypothetical protein